MEGKVILVYAGGRLISATKSNEIQTTAETVEKASDTQNRFREYVAGRKEWSVNTSYLVVPTSALHVSGSNGLKDLLEVGNIFSLVIRDRGNGMVISGQAILTTCRITATVGNLISGTFQFRGTGALT